jgi:AraC-like DNA-binding protein
MLINLFLHEEPLVYKEPLLDEQINVPKEVLNSIKNLPFRNLLYITQVSHSPQKIEKALDDYALIYCLTGKGQCATQNGTINLRSDQFILLPPGEFYNYQADTKHPWEIYCLHFNGNMINELSATFDLKRFAFPTNIVFDSQMIDSWKEIVSNLSNDFTDEKIAYANLCLYRFVSFFLFPSQEQKNTPEAEKHCQLDQSILFMKANVHKRLCVDEIAETFKYSPSHYSVLFKQKTGLSPIEYFIRLKVQHAGELLTGSDLIVKEIAGKVGYDDPFYFTRIFKKVTGKTPREYKVFNSLKNKVTYSMESTMHIMAEFNHQLAV